MYLSENHEGGYRESNMKPNENCCSVLTDCSSSCI